MLEGLRNGSQNTPRRSGPYKRLLGQPNQTPADSTALNAVGYDLIYPEGKI